MASNFTQDYNNFRTETDRKQQEERLRAVLQNSRDKRLDEQRYLKKNSIIVRSHTLLVPVTDIQAGGGGYEAERCALAISEISKCSNAEVLVGGDSVDNGNIDPACKTIAFGNRNRPSDSTIVLYDLFKDPVIKSKIIAVLGGNHDAEWGARNRASDSSISHHFADAMGFDYAPHAIIYGVPVLTDKLDVMNQYFLFIHDAGNVDSALKLVDIVYQETGILAHGVMIEHLHVGNEGIYTLTVPVYDKNSRRLGDKQHDVFIGMGFSFQNGNSSYNAQKMFKNTTNLKVYDISWTLNPYSTKSNEMFEPKYKPMINSFNVLKKDRDEVSLAMKLYQKDWGINIDAEKAKWANKSLTEVAKAIEKMTTPSEFEATMTKHIQQLAKKPVLKTKPQTKTDDEKEGF